MQTANSMNNDPLAANFVTDPTSEDIGAGVDSSFNGAREAQRNFSRTAGVVEGRPGVIESTNIDPLNEDSNKDDGWANARSTGAGVGSTANSTANTATGMASNAASAATNFATGAAKLAYGHAMGDEASKRAGAEAVWGQERQ